MGKTGYSSRNDRNQRMGRGGGRSSNPTARGGGWNDSSARTSARRGRGGGRGTAPAHKRRNDSGAKKHRVYGRNNKNDNRDYTGRIKTRSTSGRSGQGRMKPIHIGSNSIHSSWKKDLGGLIRLYIHRKNSNYASTATSHDEAMKQIEQWYIQSGCSIESTKEAILSELGVPNTDGVKLSLAIESDSTKMKMDDETIQAISNLKTANDGKGLILQTKKLRGEGPAHADEDWTVALVPKFAEHKSYYLIAENTSTLDLSCEVLIDGQKVAKNVPIPALSHRTIRPDNDRYFERHKWVFEAAKRVKIGSTHESAVKLEEEQQESSNNHSQQQKRGKRYNNQRPLDLSKRVQFAEYPDPTQYGWTFTGSVEESYVEFFEKKLNIGVMKLDWYYTTATVKTTLDHPTMGRNALYRNTVSSDLYKEILVNPRVHTNCGYRDRSNRKDDGGMEMKEDMDDEDYNGNEVNMMDDTTNEDKNETNNNNTTTTPNGDATATTTYYAKNDHYNFKIEGHMNRQAEMSKLQQSNAYQEWEKAAKEEYSFIHAKFYLSTPKYMSRQNNSSGRNSSYANNMEPEPLPEQAPVVDVKSSENATLGTKFRSVGPSANNARKSRVKMERIHGLNDDDGEDGRAAPVFECKLYYRAEDVLLHHQGEDDDDDDNGMNMDDSDQNEGATAASLSLSLPSLQDDKTEALQQIFNYHKDLSMMVDENEARDMLTKCQNRINRASNMDEVDSARKEYFVWNQKVVLEHHQVQDEGMN